MPDWCGEVVSSLDTCHGLHQFQFSNWHAYNKHPGWMADRILTNHWERHHNCKKVTLNNICGGGGNMAYCHIHRFKGARITIIHHSCSWLYTVRFQELLYWCTDFIAWFCIITLVLDNQWLGNVVFPSKFWYCTLASEGRGGLEIV